MNATSQPLLIPDDEVDEPVPAAPETPAQTVVDAACRLVDAARLPESCWDRAHGHVYQDALVRLAGTVDRMRDTLGDPRDGMPASRDDARLHFVAPGEIVETVDSAYYVTLLTLAFSSERFVDHLDRIGAASLPIYDDHTTIALTQLRDALADAKARQLRIQALRGDKTPTDDQEDDA